MKITMNIIAANWDGGCNDDSNCKKLYAECLLPAVASTVHFQQVITSMVHFQQVVPSMVYFQQVVTSVRTDVFFHSFLLCSWHDLIYIGTQEITALSREHLSIKELGTSIFFFL